MFYYLRTICISVFVYFSLNKEHLAMLDDSDNAGNNCDKITSIPFIHFNGFNVIELA